jgi:hypothetical protein
LNVVVACEDEKLLVPDLAFLDINGHVDDVDVLKLRGFYGKVRFFRCPMN